MKEKIKKSFLFENTLTKGSQRVMANKKMVADLADSIRDDVMSNPSVFPAGSKQKFQKATDEELATWFLNELDKIESEGYEGTIYSRDGVNNEWIARKYISGSHSWEDLIGVMNMNLRDWYLLKNRNMLDAPHQDLFKFNGVRDVGRYLSTHYNSVLQQVRDAGKQAALKKLAKTAKLVDNEDYTIYTVFNWAGARTVGLGTQWCTANSTSDINYKNYSSRAMLFQLFPKNPAEVNKTSAGRQITGTEKYQFDAGSHSFMDIADHRVDPTYIRDKFPFIYSDLTSAMKENSGKLQTALDAMAEDEKLQSRETKIQHYTVSEEIHKLDYFIKAGYFTKEKRPSVEQPPETPDSNSGKLQQEEYIMENVDKDVAAMLTSLKKYDMLVESMAPVLEKKKAKPDYIDIDGDGDKKEPMKQAAKQATKKSVKEGYREYDELRDKIDQILIDVYSKYGTRDQIIDVAKPMAQRIAQQMGLEKYFDEVWTNALASHDVDTNFGDDDDEFNYTDHTMHKGEMGDHVYTNKMDEEADKSKIPAALRKASGREEWKVTQKDLDKEQEKKISSRKGLEKLNKEHDLKEGADQEVLDWMKRFAKLGNMKGYGR